MPEMHAILSASKAHQWLACPPSARLNLKLSERLGDRASPYAAEGTKAHSLSELKLRHELGEINDFLFKESVKKLGGIPAEMDVSYRYEDGLIYMDGIESHFPRFQWINSQTALREIRLNGALLLRGEDLPHHEKMVLSVD